MAHSRFILMLILFLVVGATTARSGDWQTIEGSFLVTGNYRDTARGEDSQNAHLQIWLRGKTARALYERMPVEPTEDVCTDGQSKKMQGMQCLFYPWNKKYECRFSIDIAKQAIEGGFVC